MHAVIHEYVSVLCYEPKLQEYSPDLHVGYQFESGVLRSALRHRYRVCVLEEKALLPLVSAARRFDHLALHPKVGQRLIRSSVKLEYEHSWACLGNEEHTD